MQNTLFLKMRELFGALLGQSFGGRRDLYEVFGYSKTLTYQQLLGKYNRQGIASRIVNAPADALWTMPPKIFKEDTELELPLMPMLNIWDSIRRADILAGIGEFSILVIGTNGNGDPMTPLDGDTITYLQPYSQPEIQISSIVLDTASPYYKEPEIYTITPTNIKENAVSSAGHSFKIHHSRIVHIAENTLVNNIYGIPRLLKTWNDLEDLAKVSGGSSECFWLAGNRGMQVDIDKDMQLDPADEAALADEVAEYIDGMSRVLKTRGVKINNLGSDVPNPSHNFEMQISLISGTSGIPRRILIGSEAGQLASEQDRFNWAERIEERRRNFGEPVVMTRFCKRLMEAKIIAPANYTFSWPDAFQTTPLEEAQILAVKGRAIASAMSAHEKYPNYTKNFLDNAI